MKGRTGTEGQVQEGWGQREGARRADVGGQVLEGQVQRGQVQEGQVQGT